MPTDSPRNRLRAANLKRLLATTGGPTALANAMGKPGLRGHLTTMAKNGRGVGDKMAANIEEALGLAPGWMDRQHPVAGESPPAYEVAQNLSHLLGSHGIPYMPWEKILTHKEVPPVFRTVLPDDALSPDHPAGTEIVWTTRRRPTPGRIILVADRHQQLHARLCRQGREPGHWIADAVNAAYTTFDSHTDDITVVAVFKGRLEPDDD